MMIAELLTNGVPRFVFHNESVGFHDQATATALLGALGRFTGDPRRSFAGDVAAERGYAFIYAPPVPRHGMDSARCSRDSMGTSPVLLIESGAGNSVSVRQVCGDNVALVEKVCSEIPCKTDAWRFVVAVWGRGWICVARIGDRYVQIGHTRDDAIRDLEKILFGRGEDPFDAIAVEYRAALAADESAGMKASPATELRLSNATEALIKAVPCPYCGSSEVNCTGRPGTVIGLWRKEDNARCHWPRVVKMNELVGGFAL